ncbi:MAG: hypothetical protein JST00_36355 [Deltaproteobacteria bacterium]|nr:hypothetical protein [Deltaproteobacteria bacterium]
MREALALVGALAVGILAAAACGGSDEGGAGGSSSGASSSGGSSGASSSGGVQDGGGGEGGPVPPVPVTSCAPPAALVDTSSPTTKVGTGSPASCTEAALRAAVTAGGIITFDCGPAEHTITVTSELVVPNDKDTTIDGGGKVVLSGGDTTRILALRHSYEKGSPTLTVQRITLTKGKTTDTAVPGGGAAIYDLGGNVTVIDSKLVDNHGPTNGQDVKGGAIFANGAGSLVVVGSQLTNNTCSNGGAVGALGAAMTLVNTVVANNAATGTGGNPGNGGNGGGADMDGKGRTLSMCGVVFTNNTANQHGGAVFRTSYENEPTTIDFSRFDGNSVVDVAGSQAGALYLQGTKVTITSTSIVNNKAKAAAAASFYEHGGPAPGQIDMVNVTIADNAAHPQADFTQTGLTGGIRVGDRVTGTWQNVTIAGNSAQFASGIGGASARLTIRSSIIANTALNEYTPLNCNGTSANGANDVQWPAGNKANNDLDCVTGIQRADPLLGALEERDTMKVRVPGAGSPAIGMGQACPPVDQLGKPRKANGCTAGAVEVP